MGGPIGDNKGWYCPSCGKAIHGATSSVVAKRECPKCGTIEDQPWFQLVGLVVCVLGLFSFCAPNPVSGLCFIAVMIYFGWKALQWFGKQGS